MPITMTSIYKSREDILSAMLAQLTGAIPDVYTGEDGTIRIIFDIEPGSSKASTWRCSFCWRTCSFQRRAIRRSFATESSTGCR